MTFRKILEKCTAERTFWNFSQVFSEGDISRVRAVSNIGFFDENRFRVAESMLYYTILGVSAIIQISSYFFRRELLEILYRSSQ